MNKMKASVIRRFGEENELVIDYLPIPNIDDNQLLIKLEYAGVGTWDIFEREGGYSKILGVIPSFPYILGSEGAGTVIEIGKSVTRFKTGDRVSAAGFLNPKGGFYAEYVAVDEEVVSRIPSGYNFCEASVILGAGITALRGLTDVLEIKANENICIVGASGGIGHVAVQLAKGMGANICAIVSGNDGIELVKKYGIELIIERQENDINNKIMKMGFKYFDKILLTAGGNVSDNICQMVKPGGVVGFPSGVFPEPQERKDIIFEKYNGEPDRDIINRIIKLVEINQIKPNIHRIFQLNEASKAHQFIKNHYLGKIALKI